MYRATQSCPYSAPRNIRTERGVLRGVSRKRRYHSIVSGPIPSNPKPMFPMEGRVIRARIVIGTTSPTAIG
jgi:hypothetical protein